MEKTDPPTLFIPTHMWFTSTLRPWPLYSQWRPYHISQPSTPNPPTDVDVALNVTNPGTLPATTGHHKTSGG